MVPAMRRFGADVKGLLAVEFAAIAPLFIFLTVVILQIGVSYFYSTIVQASVYKLARQIEDNPGSVTAGNYLDIVQSAPNMAGFKSVVVVEALAGAKWTTNTPTGNSFVQPVADTPCAVTVAVPRPQFVPPLPLQTVFPLLFSNYIVYTVVAAP